MWISTLQLHCRGQCAETWSARAIVLQAVFRGLLRLGADAGVLDDRPPFCDFGLLERGQSFRRLLGARGDIEAEFGEALLDRRIGKRLRCRRIQFGNDVLRRSLWCPEAEPARHV